MNKNNQNSTNVQQTSFAQSAKDLTVDQPLVSPLAPVTPALTRQEDGMKLSDETIDMFLNMDPCPGHRKLRKLSEDLKRQYFGNTVEILDPFDIFERKMISLLVSDLTAAQAHQVFSSAGIRNEQEQFDWILNKRRAKALRDFEIKGPTWTIKGNKVRFHGPTKMKPEGINALIMLLKEARRLAKESVPITALHSDSGPMDN